VRETSEKGAAATAGEKASGAVARMWVGPIGERDGRRFTRVATSDNRYGQPWGRIVLKN